jgi:hypothetical protein
MMTVVSGQDELLGLRPGPAFFGGEPYSVPASKNRFMVADTLILTTSVNRFYNVDKHDDLYK